MRRTRTARPTEESKGALARGGRGGSLMDADGGAAAETAAGVWRRGGVSSSFGR